MNEAMKALIIATIFIHMTFPQVPGHEFRSHYFS